MEKATKIAQLLQAKIIKNIKQLSLEGLKKITEFSAYLVDEEEKDTT